MDGIAGWLFSGAEAGDALLSLLSLSLLGILLNIDNLVVLTMVSERLPEDKRRLAQAAGLSLALVLRLVILLFMARLKVLTAPVIALPMITLSWHDILLLTGGGYLFLKALGDVRRLARAEPKRAVKRMREKRQKAKTAAVIPVMLTIGWLDFVFSVDSTVATVALAPTLWVMIAANVIAVAAMPLAAGPFERLLERHPALHLLAASFVLMIGAALIAEGLHVPVPHGYLFGVILLALALEGLSGLRRRPGGRR
ncbi:TerC family protein [Thermopetrobacter sp. TC1]|uniref:TerC family protein n=1 Tax=Thermopetrobacter sp. TC1 TaxID=1495045 RepID=UPI00068E3850|nr:hypothetical protein [Thermopetrobacter sp. TC1]